MLPTSCLLFLSLTLNERLYAAGSTSFLPTCYVENSDSSLPLLRATRTSTDSVQCQKACLGMLRPPSAITMTSQLQATTVDNVTDLSMGNGVKSTDGMDEKAWLCKASIHGHCRDHYYQGRAAAERGLQPLETRHFGLVLVPDDFNVLRAVTSAKNVTSVKPLAVITSFLNSNMLNAPVFHLQ